MGGFAEVLLEEHAAPRVVLVGGASAAAISRDAPDAAGGVSLRAVSRDDPSLGRRRLLTWTVASHDACALHLAETSLGGANAPPPRSARVVFPRPLVPLACVLEPASEAPDAATRVATLDVSGRVYLVHLRPPSAAAVHGARGDDDSFLSRLAPSDVYAHDASADLAALEGATAMAAVGVTKIAIGGNTGRVAILDAESLAPLAELKPAALARLWNAVAGVGPEQSAIRGLRMIPRPHRTAPVLLAALRADCHLQVWDLSVDAARGGPLRPTSVLAARLPGSPDAATIGGVDRSGGDGSGMRSREARAMHVADGFLAAAISGDSFESSLPAKETEEDPRLPRRSSIFLYRLDCSGPAPPSVAFHAEVKGSEGRHAEVRVADGRVWSLDASGVGDSPAGLATRARGWPLDRGALAYPCEDLGDVATELAEWTAPGAAEQAAALLLASHPGATARDVAADLASELRQRGVAGAEAAGAALRGAGIPHDSGAVARDPVGAVAAAIVRAAGGAGASAARAVDAWSAVAGEYASSWAALRRPTGFADAGPRALALVRGTGAVSVMRPLEPAEAFVNASVAARETFVVGAADVRELAPTASPAATAVAAGAALDAALGAPARRAMDLVARGAGRGDAPEEEPGWTVPPEEDWVDAAVAAAFGRASSVHLRGSSSRALDDSSREALRKRRARHRAAAGTLRAAVAKCGGGDATRVATCCAAALDALEWVRVPPASSSGSGSFFWTDAAKSRAAAQQCRARARALRGIVLLLGATRRGGGLDSGASRDGADAAAALLPRAAAALRDALLAAWLASTPRTVGASLSETRLGASASSLAAAARGWAPAPAALSGSAAHLTAAGAALAAEVVVGSDASAYRGAYARFVEIGAELYAGGEMDALATLLNAARRVTPGDPEDPAPGAPALAFLGALRAAAGGGEDEDPESARALAAFHRAAAGTSPGEERRGEERRGEERRGEERRGSDPLLRQLVRLLHGIMSGFPVEEEEEEEEDPEHPEHPQHPEGGGGRSGGGSRKSRGLTRLEYYETLTLFFERLGRPAAASECAFAALREVPEEDAANDGRAPSDSSADARAARLWANVLQYALALGRWGDAYAAVLSTPGDEARASALRRLTAAACEPGDPRGGAAALAALPLGDRFASVAAALEARAKAAPAEASPDPAMMLYAARVARGDARGAAAAALIRARTRERDAMRAAKEADAATGSKRELAASRALAARLEAHCGALLVVVNALRLCAPGERSVALSDEDGDSFDDEKTDAAGGKAAKRRRVPGRGRATLANLLREYALAATRLELLVAGADVASLGFAEESARPAAAAADGEASSDARAAVVPGLVAACCAHGLFTAATTLATHWTEGEALTNLATVVAATLAARAALAQIAGGSGARPTSLSLSLSLEPSSLEPSSLEPGGAGGYGGALASAGGLLGGDLGAVAGRGSDRGDSPDPSACWSALRSFLETHDSPARGHRLTEAAARCALAAAPALRLPQWLQARFTSGRGANGAAGMARRGANPAALLSAYLHHDRLEEAGRLALAELGAATRAGPGGPAMPERAKHCAAWFPEPALHATRERLRGVEALAPLGDALEQALEEYRRRADADGDALAASA